MGYRHFVPDVASLDRAKQAQRLTAVFQCHEDYDRAEKMTLLFKIENVTRSEQFTITVNGQPVDPKNQSVQYAPNGRDTRIHTVTLEPYLLYEVALGPSHLKKGENILEIEPVQLVADLSGNIHLVEIELAVQFSG